MVKVTKRKKNTRQRAGTTHGYGSMKKHRGAGHRGGRGNAGSGKRGDAKKPSFWKDMSRYGKVAGFTSKRAYDPTQLNVGHLSSAVNKMVEAGKAELKKDVYVVDLTKLGIDKLLGTGVVDYKLEVSVGFASLKAVEKVEKAGGKVIMPNAAKAKTKEDNKKDNKEEKKDENKKE